MALATQCPHCRTTFRVAQDQLKLRAGLVRCGHCKEIFNGIEHLLPPTGKVQAAPRPVPNAATATAESTAFPQPVPASEADLRHPPVEHDARRGIRHDSAAAASAARGPEAPQPQPEVAQAEQAESPAPQPAPVSATTHEPVAPPEPTPDPLQRMTLVDFTQELPDDLETYPPTAAFSHAEAVAADEPDELEKAIKDLQSKPWRRAKKAARRTKTRRSDKDMLDDEDMGEDEPGFLRHGRRKQRFSRSMRLVFGIGSLLLLLAALLQGTYLFRNQIAASFPQFKLALVRLCDLADCHVDLPAQIASVSIESSELQTLASAKDRFVLNTLLRNYSGSAQEWPYIELTLNDGNEKPLLRRVFKPADYLANPLEVRAGFPAGSERPVKINFALSQVQASGYRVYLFYP